MSVFANGMEVSGKATPNKTIAAMPDVCLSPPPPPAGPVPIPYPMTGMASDTTDGCTSVIVKGKEAGKKNSTKYSKTMGNEPATNSFGANVISHKLSGALKFAAYSFDVIFEGGGACRFGDLTTQNHMNIGGGSTGASIAAPAPPTPSPDPECAALQKKNDAFREKYNDTEVKKDKDGEKVSFETSGTITHGTFKPAGGGSRAMAGASATKQLKKAGAKGLCAPVSTPGLKDWMNGLEPTDKRPQGKFVKAVGKGEKKEVVYIKMDICDGKCSGPIQGCAHAELNILNCIGRRGPTTRADSVLLGIDWNSEAHGPGNRNPCTNCKEAIKCACQCITVLICDEYGQQVDRCKHPYKR